MTKNKRSMKSTIKILGILIMSVFLVMSCEKDAPIEPNNPDGIIEHSEDITSDKTWNNENIHLVTDYIAIKNATLTIEPGTVVKFRKRSGLSFGYDETPISKLIAKGEKGKEIIFKADKESMPWEDITFGNYNSKESIMEYCIFENGGGDSRLGDEYRGTIRLENTAITFTNNVIKDSKYYGVYADVEGRFVNFTGNTITNSSKSSIHMGLQWAHTIGAYNQIDNDGYGILLEGEFNHNNKKTWRKHTCPYTLDTDINDRLNGTLEIEAGTIIQIAQNGQLYIGDTADEGKEFTLIAKGTPTERIVFKPADEYGTWDSFYFKEGAGLGCHFKYCDFIGGGYDTYSTLLINVSVQTPKIENCNISGHSSGLYIYNSPQENILPYVKQVTYLGNQGKDVEYAYDDGLKLED